MTKRPLIIGNWKMYIESLEEAKKFAAQLRKKARAFAGVDAVLMPPAPFVATIAAALKGSSVAVGAQNISEYLDAKHTGEESAAMIKSAGASYVLIGHSERRADGESAEQISQKIRRAAEAKLTVVLCVGEQERDAAGGHFGVVEEQIASALKPFATGNQNKEKMPKLIVAYEPAWAIGKSAQDAMSAADVREMSIFIQKTLAELFDRTIALKVPILYGAAVEAANARTLIAEGGIAGLLVGHASAELDSFLEILTSVSKK